MMSKVKVDETLEIIGRDFGLFENDLKRYRGEIEEGVKDSSFLILGGAGSIGRAVTKEVLKREPKKVHVVDINENNLAELVRDIRNTFPLMSTELKTFAIDIGSVEYDAFWNWDGNYDYILNLSALKHVRSEKDPFTLMRMVDVNILNTNKTLVQSKSKSVKKYFAVSTDKATNPVNMMGASKRIMEFFLMRENLNVNVSSARFANVAFSDGSLLHSYEMRIRKGQPLVAPKDVKRYFMTQKEAGQLCLMSCLLGKNREIFFPKLRKGFELTSFVDVAIRFLEKQGFEPYMCEDEREAFGLMVELKKKRKWPVLLTVSDTTGEKEYEEFFADSDVLEVKRFKEIGVIRNEPFRDGGKLEYFIKRICELKKSLQWSKVDIVELFRYMIPEFVHLEKGKYLDDKI